ncbi:MAG: MFS transporter [Anaerolineae bacterium]|jgi:MFS transporter, FHS family, glucose/mannose:H+ symporter|nr:MFS transporter [Anaerolineae bacterium]MBT7781865.1 MFS transporter [Anaerolineae bacterium]
MIDIKENSTKLIRIMTIGSFLAFFLFGFSDNLKGATLPVLLDDLSFNYAYGGTILLLSYIGFLIATLITGPLSDIVGKKSIILLASVFLLVGIFGYSIASTFLTLSLAMFVIGLGLGALEVGANLIIIDIHCEDKARYLNLLAFFHGAGSMVAPLYAGQMLLMGFSWRSIYQFGLGVVLIVLIYFLLAKYPRTSTLQNNKLNFRKLGKSLFSVQTVLIFLGIALYVSAEIGVGVWLVEFLQTIKLQSVRQSTFYLALFFGAITAGRLVGSFLVNRIGYMKSVFYAGIAAVIFSSIGIFASADLAIFLPLAGLFFSIIFPTLTASISDIHQENQGTVLGLLFTFAGLGGMLGPWTVGLISDWVGMQRGFGIILAFLILMNIFFFILLKKENQPA